MKDVIYLKHGHFKGKFIVDYRGCPYDPNTWISVSCSECIYYREENSPGKRCLNYRVFVPVELCVYHRLHLLSYIWE